MHDAQVLPRIFVVCIESQRLFQSGLGFYQFTRIREAGTNTHKESVTPHPDDGRASRASANIQSASRYKCVRALGVQLQCLLVACQCNIAAPSFRVLHPAFDTGTTAARDMV